MFQEFFAAEALSRELLDPRRGTEGVDWQRFTELVLNEVSWEEPLLFLMEKFGTANDDEVVLGFGVELVRRALFLDPVAAARLAHTGGPAIWARCRGELSRVLRSLASGHGSSQELGFFAILETGSPDFADIVAPIAFDGQPANLSSLFRLAPASAVRCLGSDWRADFCMAAAETRERLVRGLNWEGEWEAVELLADIAKTDPEPQVKLAAMLELVVSGSADLVAPALSFDPSPVWDGESGRSLIHVLPLHLIRDHAKTLRALLPTTGPSTRLAILHRLADAADAGVEDLIEGLLSASPSESEMRSLLPDLQRLDQDRATRWVVGALLASEQWAPFLAEHITTIGETDLERIATAALTRTVPVAESRRRLALLSAVSTRKAAESITREWLEEAKADAGYLDTERSSAVRLALLDLPMRERVASVVERDWAAATKNEVKAVLAIVGPHTPFELGYREELPEALADTLRDVVLQVSARWRSSYMATGSGEPAMLACVLGAVGQRDDIPLLETWIGEARDADTRAAAAGSRVNVDWSHWYAGAVSRLDCDEGFALLTRLVHEPDYLGAASQALQWMVEHSPPPLKAARSSQATKVIREVFEPSLLAKEKGDKGKPYPYSLGEAAKVLARLGNDEAVPLLLRLGHLDLCQDAAIIGLWSLASKGARVPGVPCNEIVGPVLDKALRESTRTESGYLWWLAARGLCLLMLSDRPSLGVEGFRKCWELLSHTGTHKEVLALLGTSSEPSASVLLEDLARTSDDRGLWYGELIRALGAKPRLGIIHLLLEIWESKVNQGAKTNENTRFFAEAIAGAATNIAEEWTELKERVMTAHGPAARHLLSAALMSIGNPEAAITACYLIDDTASPQVPAPIALSIRRLFLSSEQPATGHVQPHACNELRAHLLHLALTDASKSRSAHNLLLLTEVERAWMGRPSDEPRHPDVRICPESSPPWYLPHP